MPFRISRSTRLSVVIGISTCFFLGEISSKCGLPFSIFIIADMGAVGFYTHSLALIADAFTTYVVAECGVTR